MTKPRSGDATLPRYLAKVPCPWWDLEGPPYRPTLDPRPERRPPPAHRQTVVSSKAGLTTTFLPEPNLAEPRRGSWSGSRPSYVADSKPQRAPSCGAELSSWAGLGMVFSLILPAGAGRVNLTRVKDQTGNRCTLVFALGKDEKQTKRMHDAMRPRQGPSVRHRVEDGVKKHRGLTAASSSHRVSRHVTLRTAPSSSVKTPTRAYQPRGRDVPARAIRSRACQCALYFCIRRSPCLRTVPSYHQRAARAILEG